MAKTMRWQSVLLSLSASATIQMLPSGPALSRRGALRPIGFVAFNTLKAKGFIAEQSEGEWWITEEGHRHLTEDDE